MKGKLTFGVFTAVLCLLMLAACDPIEGSIEEVKVRAGADGIRYTVTFESNGGTPVVSQRVREGATASRPQNPTRGTEQFVNWFSDDLFNEFYKFSTPVTKNIILYADWAPASALPCTVTFNSNGGSFVDDQIVYSGKKVYRPDNPVKRGHEFGGWYTANGDPPTGEWNFSSTVPASMILYAKWDKITFVPGANIVERFAWLKDNAISSTEYYVVVGFSEPPLETQNLSYPSYTDITINLEPTSSHVSLHLISLSGNGSLFSVGSGVSLVLGNKIALQGHSDNSSALVYVMNGGKLIMNSNSTITGNKALAGGGVYVAGSGSSFTMTGGTISGNTSTLYGNGVYVLSGSFTMNGGTISNNSGSGAGVNVNGGNFTMNGGTISGHIGSYGGVTVDGNGNFTMTSGIISGNTAISGAGVDVIGTGSSFNMTGGTISGNTASYSGGGVNIGPSATFNKSGGTISGSNETPETDRNTAAVGGNAVYVSSTVKRETTVTAVQTLDWDGTTATGSWTD